MSDEPSNKLAVLVHHNNEVTVFDERGVPRICRDCRFSGWLTGYERQTETHPRTCLLFSGGADVRDGDRVLLDHIRKSPTVSDWSAGSDHRRAAHEWRKKYPLCGNKNNDGKCKDYVKAKSLPWWGNFWKKLRGREWRTRKMRE